MNKKAIVVFLLCFIILLIYHNSKNNVNQSDNDTKKLNTDTLGGNLISENALPLPSKQENPEVIGYMISLVEKIYEKEPPELGSLPHPDYVWYKKPTSKGVVKNSKGEVIFQATQELPFISLRSKVMIPQIVIIAGNRNAFIINPETKERVALPKEPPIPKAKGFETWEWVDQDTLLAEYYVQTKGSDGARVSCCEGHSIAETKLYVYTIKNHLLHQVYLPKNLKGMKFSLGRIASNGSIEIMTSTTHLDQSVQIGWFNLIKK